MNSPRPIPIPISEQALAQAKHYAKQPVDNTDAKRVFRTTLAITAVESYLHDILVIETDRQESHFYQPFERCIFDVSDLWIPGYGRLECRIVTSEASSFSVISDAESDVRGYVVVQLPAEPDDLENAENEKQEVVILGFIKADDVHNLDDSSISLEVLKDMDDFIQHLCFYEALAENLETSNLLQEYPTVPLEAYFFPEMEKIYHSSSRRIDRIDKTRAVLAKIWAAAASDKAPEELLAEGQTTAFPAQNTVVSLQQLQDREQQESKQLEALRGGGKSRSSSSKQVVSSENDISDEQANDFWFGMNEDVNDAA